MNAPIELDWTTANQQFLVAEFARLLALLTDTDPSEAEANLQQCQNRLSAPAAIDELVARFQLSSFERDVILLTAGVEMDATLADVCHETTGKPYATFGLAMARLHDAHWSAIAPLDPLRRWRLIEVDESAGLTAGRLRIDERTLHYLAGLNYLDHRLQAMLTPIAPATLMADEHMEQASRLSQQIQTNQSALPVIQLIGDDPQAQRDVARLVSDSLNACAFCLPAANIPTGAHESASLAILWQREAALLGGTLLLTGADEHADAVDKFVQRLNGLVMISAREPLSLESASLVEKIDKPDAVGQRKLWRQALGDHAEPLTSSIDNLASRCRLAARRIGQIAAEASQLPDSQRPTHLHKKCQGDDSALCAMAQPIESCTSWDDLVLPDMQRRLLEQIAVHSRQRIRVHYDWGFADKGERGLGLASLFAGESGTGKTLAAEVLAHELGIPLYRIDLSAVVSKYIGETEKNLSKVFDAAEDIGAILLFDEADALFGKRSEVKDSHDRYANIEVSYLLQRMEAYRGLAILTTNHKTALDTAFSRRLRFVVNFPFPNATQREAIWRTVFPAKTPLDKLDFKQLARLNVAGGNIRNIALTAAFLAAEADTAVTMGLLRQAAHIEAAKRDKPFSDTETRGWV